MTIVPTKWEFSEMTAKEKTPLTEGAHTLRITGAGMDTDNNYYWLSLQDINDESQESTVRYYLIGKDGQRNERSVGTLNSLSYVIYGIKEGLPFPDDIINGIVNAEVKLTVAENGKTYVNIYHYDPIDALTLEMAKSVGTTIDQHTEG